MLKAVSFIFCIISLAILMFCWIYISANISFYFKSLFKNYRVQKNPIVYSIIIGFILEILLSAVSILVCAALHFPEQASAPAIRSGLKNGAYYTIILSPVCSIFGALIGIRSNMPIWKRL